MWIGDRSDSDDECNMHLSVEQALQFVRAAARDDRDAVRALLPQIVYDTRWQRYVAYSNMQDEVSDDDLMEKVETARKPLTHAARAAARHGHLEILKLILRASEDVADGFSEISGYMPLLKRRLVRQCAREACEVNLSYSLPRADAFANRDRRFRVVQYLVCRYKHVFGLIDGRWSFPALLL